MGKFKKENTFLKYVSLAPKVYGGITSEGEEIVKVKGYKNIISFDQLKQLLKKDSSLELNQEKWYKNLEKGSIKIKQEIYTLAVTENKRKLIYDDNGILIDTMPFTLNDNMIVENDTRNESD